MNANIPLTAGKIRAFATSNHQPISALAVKVIGELDVKALIIDGTARVNPYWIVRVCKEYGYDIDTVLENIIIARGFTAYQLKDMIGKVEEIVRGTHDLRFLGLIDFSSRFKDEDLKREEGIWLRSKSIKKIQRVVDMYDLFGAVADPNPNIFRKRSRDSIETKTVEDIEKAKKQNI
ncbi:MAG: hypothetical protein ACOCZJ_00325 [Thermoplasmatota archaeon]